ncbi:retrovirus-related Pol polyprotein from transposon TNT 1-94 [Trichonephila clavipes]|nr:retrovirus-related Pol polyprotein from transposon TNT 1-94 [Trichonephila clavipes]
MSLATEDKSCPVEGIGTLRFRVKYKGSFHEITLTDVLFNPKLRRNLLSGSRLESKGAHFVGTKGKNNVLNKDWIKLFSATRHENLYFFKPDHYIIPKSKEIIFSDVTAKTKNGSIDIWHQRFCHVNNDYLVKTSKNDSVKGLPRLTDNGKTHSIPCKLAKSKRVSFKKMGAVRSKRPLELLHMDLCGPMPTESQGGNKYFLSIIDDYSRKVTVFPIRNKSDVFHTFIRFQKRAERFLSKRKHNTESQGFSDLSEQQEALMVEVTIPNCYKQAIRSRDASKWHDAMDKEINGHTQELNDNFSVAEKRVKSLTRRFIRDPTLYIQYSKILKEYESQGIIERVLETEKPTDRAVFYLPHQAVFRQESLTTKMRIVFDASSHEDGQPSLNDCIWSGGNLNPNIFHLIISFRLNTIAITADIERAFLQISLRDEDRDAVRFLFPDIRSNQTDPYKFQVYRFKRVMFGVNVSPFLLSATIKHHIENYREQYPAATEMLDTCLYVLMTTSAIGHTSKPITKRIVLQSAGKIYDPVGFLSPYTIRLKCLLQELWLRKLSWDDELPPDIHAVWSQWWLELPFLSELKIPRKILDSSGDSSEVQIHTFSDASQKAYGAAAFLRVKHKDRVSVDLVTSKSRVAPLKRLSLPRLELMGALLAACLAKEVKKILDQKCSTRAFFWTDSQVTLHWIKGPSHRWKPFVANRVREIQSLTDPNSWFHCSGKDNPADLLTRGISVDALTTNSKWWNGSSFLRQIVFQTKGLDEAIPERVYLTEMRKNSNPKEDISLTLTVTKNNFLENIIDISNNYVKLIRVVSFLYRFIHDCRTRITKIKGPLTSQEVSHVENWLIHSLHEREFYEEMRKLLAGEPIPMKSKLTPLNVFLDESNIIRVGGRLANSNLNEKAKFPMILPSRNVLTDIILSHYHKKYLHAGPHSLLYLVRQKFWPLNGRNNRRRIIQECVNCFKNKPITMNQIMANLPRDRVTPNYPFNVTGVDFTGPFFIKFKNQRKGALNKIYVCI